MPQLRNKSIGRKTVLVADGDPAVLCLARAILMGEGYRVLLATAAEGAVRLANLESLRIDLALVGKQMDESGGAKLAEQLIEVRPHMPVAFLSRFVDDKVIRMRMPALPELDTTDSPLKRSAGVRCAGSA